MSHMQPSDRPDQAGRLETDVLVIGAGPAGMAATAAAAGTGAAVMALEAGDRIGGNAVWSTGYVAFVGSDAQRRAGIGDSTDRFLDDAARIVDQSRDHFAVIWDRDLTRIFAEHSAETYRILTDAGVRFTRFIPRPQQHSVDRMLAAEDPRMFATAFAPAFDRANVTLHTRTLAQRLIVTDGRVTGVLARRMAPDGSLGALVEISARSGVVLASGGYQANPELRARHQPGHRARTPYLGIDTCRGDAHLMGAAVGGDLINMSFVPPLVIVSSSFVEDSIAVNGMGARFHDEAGPYDARVAALDAQPGRAGVYVLDDVTATAKAHLFDQMPGARHRADTLEDLAAQVGCDAAALRASVERWNGFLAGSDDRDPDFGRVVIPAGRRPIIQPPFHATDMVVGINFCCGGFRVSSAMQVVSVFGDPIPGLYAAGDAVGGLNPCADLGGIHLGGGFTLGRLAGLAAAEGRQAPVQGPSLQGAGLPSMLQSRIALVNLAPGA